MIGKTVEETADVMKILADKTRLSIVGFLFNNDYCVCEFVELFNISQPAVSQHIK